MAWNIGKEMSENYEFFSFIFMNLQARIHSDKELIGLIYQDRIAEEKQLFQKPLGSDFLRMLDTEKDPMGLIVKGHLFIENFLDAIITNKLKYPDLVLRNNDFTFSLKLNLLRACNYLDEKQYNDIKHITRLRNKFAHNLYYDFSQLDVRVFSYCEDYHKYVRPQTKKSVIYANFYVLKYVFFYLLLRLTSRYKFIADVEMPEDITVHKI